MLKDYKPSKNYIYQVGVETLKQVIKNINLEKKQKENVQNRENIIIWTGKSIAGRCTFIPHSKRIMKTPIKEQSMFTS